VEFGLTPLPFFLLGQKKVNEKDKNKKVDKNQFHGN